MDIPSGAPQSSSGGKIALIIIIVLLVLCCCCACLTIAGAAAYLSFVTPTHSTTNPMPEFLEPTFVMPTIIFETPALPFPFQRTPTVEETPTPEETATPKAGVTQTETPTAGKTSLGVSRQEMIDFFNSGDAFTFEKPITVQGVEMVQGTHSSLCVNSDCAAVTLGGPEDDLQVVSVVAPTGTEHGQAVPAFALLMNTAVRFIDPNKDGDIPLVIMQDLLSAIDDGKQLEKTFESHGYQLVETYDPKLHQAGLAITRAK